MIKEAIRKIVEGVSLTEEEAKATAEEIMAGEASPVHTSAFLVALRMKGETVDEVTGMAKVMREKMIKIIPQGKHPVIVDTCGTGGDAQATFNVSTIVAFIVSAAGYTVAKHGNRAVSSHCGSADLLEALGVKIELSAEQISKCLDEIGIGFIFAPLFHPAMRHVMPVRKELGIRTVFNILGPLCNPASANVQLLGVFSKSAVALLAEALSRLGTESAYVIHGDGIDEITLSGKSYIGDVYSGKVTYLELDPREYNFKYTELGKFKTRDKEENCKIFIDILNGVKSQFYDISVLNAGVGIYLADRIAKKNNISTISDGIRLACELVDSGRVKEKFEEFKKFVTQL